jgi:UBA-like domain
MAKKKEREAELELSQASSREELQRAVVVKMKAVTNADEEVCISILEDNRYDLKQSVEAFFQISS